jgi:hypothetical protein
MGIKVLYSYFLTSAYLPKKVASPLFLSAGPVFSVPRIARGHAGTWFAVEDFG